VRARRLLFAAALAASLAARQASALPVAYATAAKEPVFAHTGVVVMMREGTRTILSIQTNYDGPIEPFVLIVPLPVELKPSEVRTLPRTVFERVAVEGAPRLVEYWEEDPCEGQRKEDAGTRRRPSRGAASARATETRAPRTAGAAHVAAEEAPSEYDVHVLTEPESARVVDWLRVQSYVVSAELATALDGYARAGAHFVAARFDPVKHPPPHDPGRLAMLPPLRLAFESDRFELPIGLGRAISAGTQDLVLYTLARHQRYAAMPWDGVLAPTAIEMTPAAAAVFPSVYRGLFDRVASGHARAAVTEYVHDAIACDPCAAPPLDARDLLTLGADALPAAPGERESPNFGSGFVLTRMQLRYAKDDPAPDITLAAAEPLAGTGGHDDFQALYTLHHAWDGPMPCDSPARGRYATRGTKPRVAPRLAFGPRDDVDLAAMVKDDVPALSIAHAPPPDSAEPAPAPPPPPPPTAAATARSSGSGCGCATAPAETSPVAIAIVALALLRRRR
jgi:MYXO-CTERM domain-containing protein